MGLKHKQMAQNLNAPILPRLEKTTRVNLSTQSQPFEQENLREVTYATYLDIAVLRCLVICDWKEPGVCWSLTYLVNRLADFNYTEDNGEKFLKMRPRS